MIIPFRRTKKSKEFLNGLKVSFVILQDWSGRQLILKLTDVQVMTAENETMVTGKSIR